MFDDFMVQQFLDRSIEFQGFDGQSLLIDVLHQTNTQCFRLRIILKLRISLGFIFVSYGIQDVVSSFSPIV